MMQMVRWPDNKIFKFESRTNGERGGVGEGKGKGAKEDAKTKSTAKRQGYPRRE